jgi:hypothetical protein
MENRKQKTKNTAQKTKTSRNWTSPPDGSLHASLYKLTH